MCTFIFQCIYADGSPAGIVCIKVVGSRALLARLSGCLDFLELESSYGGQPTESPSPYHMCKTYIIACIAHFFPVFWFLIFQLESLYCREFREWCHFWWRRRSHGYFLHWRRKWNSLYVANDSESAPATDYVFGLRRWKNSHWESRSHFEGIIRFWVSQFLKNKQKLF